MAEYIEREAALALCQCRVPYNGLASENANKIMQLIEDNVKEIPAADVVEVRHGWWAKKNVGFLKTRFCCSICGRWEHEYAYEHSDMNYCPNCGAKMDGKGEGE